MWTPLTGAPWNGAEGDAVCGRFAQHCWYLGLLLGMLHLERGII